MFNWAPTGLPVEERVDAITAALTEHGTLVLTAEPGAGKSSLVPLITANAIKGRVVLLQPRRLAARATATRLASLLGERLGDSVGLTIRGERKVSGHCRIEVVTEAVLTNRLLEDAELPGVGAVIFDEFHERSVHADLGLAMALESRSLLRPDLAVVVMSATIDAEPIASLLDNAPTIAVEGRTFGVEMVYHHRPSRQRWAQEVAHVTQMALAERAGDALVFVPGRGEVHRVVRQLGSLTGVEVLGLDGGTPADRQRDILSGGSTRRVIVATAIAETSITVPGVTIVVDGGLARRPQFDAASGLGALETIFVPRFGADQRRGRAGRIEAGICHRMWSAEDERHLSDAFAPEILAGDPLPLALALARWGDPEASDLRLLDHPGTRRLHLGRAALTSLGIVDDDGTLTALGAMAGRIPAHPRVAAALLACAGSDVSDEAVRRLAAVEEGVRFGTVDLELASSSELNQARDTAKQLRDRIQRSGSPSVIGTFSEALLLAWPDRVAMARPGRTGRFLLASGTEVQIPETDPMSSAPFIIVAAADGESPNTRVRAAVATDRSTVLGKLADHIQTKEIVEWDERTSKVVAAIETRLGAIVLHSEPSAAPDQQTVRAALLGAVRRIGTDGLRWTETGRDILHRLRWLHTEDPNGWPLVDETALLDRLDEWVDMGKANSPSAITAGRGLLNLLDWQQRQGFESSAPSTLATPADREIPIDYSSGRPVWSVRLQWLFGLDTHPALGPNNTPVTIELLTPANRPAQTTNDLPGFWRGSYAAVRADLRGRYPKHPWPEDPLTP